MTALAEILAARIARDGPISIAEYMETCLSHPEHGYYATRDPFGKAGDFTTAPEISQMFGELLGLWAASLWAADPGPVKLVEIGPGRGTLMADALRAADRVPGFREAADVWLIETSPVLQARQRALLGDRPTWGRDFHEVPPGRMILLANELFDALPINQFEKTETGWSERVICATALPANGWQAAGKRLANGAAGLTQRAPDVAPGTVLEICPAGEGLARAIGARIAEDGGAALILDYGDWEGTGDTLQAVRDHAPIDPLACPGEADLTAHVAFGALAAASGLSAWFDTQGAFLERLGITARAEALARAQPARRAEITAAHRRLTHPDEMGTLFKALALLPMGTAPPAGFAP